MKNDGIEDILIGANSNSKNKKGKTAIIIIFVVLLLILIGMAGAYWYYTTQTISEKQIFIKHMKNMNMSKMVENDVYKEIGEKLAKENSKMNSSINFSTNVENEELSGVDISKFVLELNSNNDIKNSKSYNELGINYSDNELINLKLITAENEVAVASNEITDKYIGVHLDKLKDVFGIDINIEDLEKIKDSDNIELSDEEKQEYLKKYAEKIFNSIGEEKFTSQENIGIKKDSETVYVTAHTLTLEQEELNQILVQILEDLKNDEELLNKIVTNSKKAETTIKSENTNTINEEQSHRELNEDNNEIEDLENQDNNRENNDEQDNMEDVNNRQQENNLDEENNQEENSEDFNAEIEVNKSKVTFTPVSDTDNAEEDYLLDCLIRIIQGKKIDTTVKEFQKNIDKSINKIKKYKGNGLKATIYASDEKNEKVALVLPNENTIDLEFITSTDAENNIKLTYLYKGNNHILNMFNDDEVVTYTAEDKINEAKEEKDITNGFSLDLSKLKNGANTTVKALLSIIEDEKINKKVNLNLKTDITGSGNYKNDVVITLSTNEGETKIIIDNNINFTNVDDIEELTEENSIFLDTLSEEELNQTIENILNKTMEVVITKRANLSFIDTNTNSSKTLDKMFSSVTREQAKEALITKVSVMMRDAIDRDEEFTIQNLKDLKIDGYEVSSTVTGESAVIVVDVYTFNIDSNFTLTDVE